MIADGRWLRYFHRQMPLMPFRHLLSSAFAAATRYAMPFQPMPLLPLSFR
jgi:hypothetical protein